MEIVKTDLPPKTKNDKGFTLVELLVAMVISSIIAAAIFSTFRAQRRIYETQSQITELQQNARAAFWYMAPEIKMAGFDPTLASTAGIMTATQGVFGFSMDVNDDDDTGESDGDIEDPNEYAAFGFSIGNDPDRDGRLPGSEVAPLGRRPNTASGFQPVVDNISAIEFFYTLKDGTQTHTPADPNDIVAVDVSILARTKHPDRNFTNNMEYSPVSALPPPKGINSGVRWGAFNDNYRRYLLTSSIQLRNQGMK